MNVNGYDVVDSIIYEMEAQIEINTPSKNKKNKIFSMDDINVTANDTYLNCISMHLNELLQSPNITTADHLNNSGEMLLHMTRTDNRICHKLSNGSVSMAENNKLYNLYANGEEDQKENKYDTCVLNVYWMRNI